MIHNELAVAVEEVAKAAFPFRTVEDILLVELHHWESASLGVQLVALFRDFFLVRQVLRACREPFIARDDFGMCDVVFCHDDFSFGLCWRVAILRLALAWSIR